uniref:(northern house mosquito) hypothetical protein n=1 Tax=Culex pipiens TaxID=7175 RepID=A0A8D8FSQ4_CULPI
MKRKNGNQLTIMWLHKDKLNFQKILKYRLHFLSSLPMMRQYSLSEIINFRSTIRLQTRQFFFSQMKESRTFKPEISLKKILLPGMERKIHLQNLMDINTHPLRRYPLENQTKRSPTHS